MKNLIILLLFLSVLSCKQISPVTFNQNIEVDSQLVTFVTIKDTIIFYNSEKEHILKLFQKADSLVYISDSKSSKIDTLGNIDNYEFIFHQFYIDNSNLLKYFIIIRDTINNKEVYVDKIDTFADNILKYSGIYYY